MVKVTQATEEVVSTHVTIHKQSQLYGTSSSYITSSGVRISKLYLHSSANVFDILLSPTQRKTKEKETKEKETKVVSEPSRGTVLCS